MKTKPWALPLIIACTLCMSIATIFNKRGAMLLDFTLQGTFFNVNLIIGLFLMGLATLFLIGSLKGGDVTAVYPVIATSYVWVILISHYMFDEIITWYHVIGILGIVSGVIILNISSQIKKWVGL